MKIDRRESLRLLAAILLPLAITCGESDDTAWLTVNNRSTSSTVTGIYAVRTAQWAGWGINWLTASIDPGGRHSIDLPPDTWDIRIESDHADAPYDISGLALRDGEGVLVEVSDITIEVFR